MSAMENVFGSGGTKISNAVVGIPSEGTQFQITPLDKLKSDVNELIEEYNYSGQIKLVENERGLTIHILEEIIFSSGVAELTPNAKTVLGRLAAIIRVLPNDIRVEGHTDNIPIKSSIYQSNWHLSVARALNTAYFLIDNQNISPDKVSIVGYSEYMPLESNETKDGRKTNRRVDIVIIKQ